MQGADGEAKFWLEPKIELAQNYGLSRRALKKALELIEERANEIHGVWDKHFPG